MTSQLMDPEVRGLKYWGIYILQINFRTISKTSKIPIKTGDILGPNVILTLQSLHRSFLRFLIEAYGKFLEPCFYMTIRLETLLMCVN